MMSKRLLFLVLIFIGLAGKTQTAFKNITSIKAFLPGWNGAQVLLKIDGRTVKADTVQRDLFSYTQNISSTQPASLELRKNGAALFVPFYIEPGTIRFRDKGNRNLEAFGTTTNNDWLVLNHQIDSLSRAENAATEESRRQYKRGLTATYVREHPQSLISLQLLNDYYFLDEKAKDTTYYALLNLLDTSLKQTLLGAKLQADAAIYRNSLYGSAVPNLLLPDTSNIKTPLYETGQFTLLQFWASWCRPCRIENPALKSVYQKYKDKGFAITSISLDDKGYLWKAAIKKDGLSWRQVSDLKGWYNEAAKTFGIRFIPMNILVDKNGKVVDKNLSPYQLDRKLAQLMQPSF